MSQFTSDAPAGPGPAEAVFVGTSQWRLYFPLVFGVGVAAWLALELGLGARVPTLLGVDPVDARTAAGCIGGVVGFASLVLAWMWYGRLRWVAVSETGLSWRRHGRAHTRAWSEFAGVRRKVVDLYRTGRRLEAAYGSEVQFHTGRPLLISPDTVREHDALLAAIEAGARGRAGLGGSSFGGSSCDRLPGWTSQFGAAPEEGLWFGPLRLRPDGVQWGKKLLHWDHVKSYEVSHGYLLITAEDGTEFLRRLPELGDWQLALDRLDELIGAKRVGALAAAK